MTRRPAVTLLEALMAIFVMAIGLLALLTLFPLGAVSMAQALKDQRTAETANNSTALFKALQLTSDPVFSQQVQGASGSVFQDSWPAAKYGVNGLSPIIVGPSYPVYIDPFNATYNLPDPFSTNVPLGNLIPGIQRCTVANPVIASNPQRWCTLLDDIGWADNSLPADQGLVAANSNVIQREGRYSFAYMVRRASANTADLPLDLTVVVYSGRQPGVDLFGNPNGETAFTASFVSTSPAPNPTLGSLQITYGNQKPALRRGSWILDARMTDVPGGAPNPQGYFYRVTNVTDVSATVVQIEIQAPAGAIIRGPYGVIPNSSPAQVFSGSIVVMDNVSEVFAKNTNY